MQQDIVDEVWRGKHKPEAQVDVAARGAAAPARGDIFIVTPSTATPWRDASSASRWGRYRRAQRRSSSATTLCSHAFCRGDKAPLHLPRGNVICTVPAERRTVACSTSAKRKLKCRSSVLTQNRGVITILNPAMAYSAWIDLDFCLVRKKDALQKSKTSN